MGCGSSAYARQSRLQQQQHEQTPDAVVPVPETQDLKPAPPTAAPPEEVPVLGASFLHPADDMPVDSYTAPKPATRELNLAEVGGGPVEAQRVPDTRSLEEQENDAAVKIQAVHRGKKDREMVKRLEADERLTFALLLACYAQAHPVPLEGDDQGPMVAPLA